MKQKLLILLATIATFGAGFLVTHQKPIVIVRQPVIEQTTQQIENPVRVIHDPASDQSLSVSPGPAFGSTVPVIESLFETSLASGIGSADSSMTLAIGTDRAGNNLAGYMCFTIDSGTATVEYVCGTTATTTVSSLVRGIDPITGTTTVATLQFSHRRGADVKITDYPSLGILSRIVNGNDTFPNKITYGSAPTFTAGLDIVDKTYADALAIAGSPNGSTSQKGIFQEATGAQLQAGTAAGSTGADLVAPASLFSQTASAAIIVPVTNSSGKLAQGFLDLTQSFSFSTATSTATSTDSVNLIPAGAIEMYAATTSPAGWLLADGTSYATSTYPRHSTVIGYTPRGSGASFNVPDLRARSPRGYASATSSVNTLGKVGGEETHTMLLGELVPHTHTLSIGQASAGTAGATALRANDNTTGLTTETTSSSGSGSAFNVLNPYITVNYIIKY